MTGSELRPLFPAETTGLAGFAELDFRAGAAFAGARGPAPAATRLRNAGFFRHRSVSVSQEHCCSLKAWGPVVGHFPNRLR